MWLNPWKNAASMISSARILAAPLFFYAVKYDQQTAQDEFLKNSNAAQNKRRLLDSAERGQFDGKSGINVNPMNNQGYGMDRSGLSGF